LLEVLSQVEGGLKGLRVFLPRAEVARNVLVETIRSEGGRVEVMTAYRVVTDPATAGALCRAARIGDVRGVTLTSGRAAQSLGEAWHDTGGGDWPRNVLVGVIGPVTAAAAHEVGIPVHRVPEEFTLPALAREMGRALRECE